MILWGVTDGSAGMVAQVQSLAAALSMQAEMKVIQVKAPYVWLPNAVHSCGWQDGVWPGMVLGAEKFSGPWPRVIVSCGRRAALAMMGLRRSFGDTTCRPLFVNIQDPQMPARHFDAVIAMAHDKLRGDNVVVTDYALHQVTPDRLSEAGAAFADFFAGYPHQRVAVLLGGSTNKYTLTKAGMDEVIKRLRAVLAAQPCSLLITPSRRTGAANVAALKEAFAGDARVYLYDFTGPNPYLALLALADHIICTDDSVNMMTEAQATGKPLHLLGFPGHRGTKPTRFAEMLVHTGAARALEPKLEEWHYAPSAHMQTIAERVKVKLANAVW